MPEGRRPTSADVAREAGVSRATVSYVLNDAPYQKIPEPTRRRVLDAAARLGYAPSAAARTLRTGRSDIVLGLLPDWPIEHVLGRVLQRLTAAFADRELTFLVHTWASPSRPLREMWKTVSPAAVLVLEEFPEPEAEAEAMRAAGIEVVMAMQGVAWGLPSAPMITESPIGALQARHLVEAGHRRLGYAYPDLEKLSSLAEPRLDGVRKVCAELGLPQPDVQVVPLAPHAAVNVVRAWRDADPPVTGVCAFNDEVAIALLAALRLLDLHASRDLAVIGVDDIPGAKLAHPPLTTIARDIDALARGLAARVVDALSGQPLPTEPIRDELSVVARESA